MSEFIFTAIYVFLTLPHLQINKESMENIVHKMGIIRVNAFSITNKDFTIATGLFWPANFINHDCVNSINVKP